MKRYEWWPRKLLNCSLTLCIKPVAICCNPSLKPGQRRTEPTRHLNIVLIVVLHERPVAANVADKDDEDGPREDRSAGMD